MDRKLFYFACFLALAGFGCADIEYLSADGACANDICTGAAPMMDAAAPRKPKMMMGRNRRFEAPEGRQMSFAADLALNVSDIRTALQQTRDLIRAIGGYVKMMDNTSATVAVPVGKAEETMEKLSALGVVSSLRITAQDVTDQLCDLKVRIENLEKSRRRLLAMMERSAKVEELVQVERELTRVTTELERLQAQQKSTQDRVAFVTVSIRFHATSPAPLARPDAPLAWVNRLGSSLLDKVEIGGTKEAFDAVLPDHFVWGDADTAFSGRRSVIAYRKEFNSVTKFHWYGNEYAGLDFYREMISAALKTRFKDEKIEVIPRRIDGLDALEYRLTPSIGNTKYFYRAVIVPDDDTLHLIEARGSIIYAERDLPDAQWKAFLDSINF